MSDDLRRAIDQLERDIEHGEYSGGGYTYIEATPEALRAVLAALSSPSREDVPGGCIYCSSSGVIEDYEGDRPCSNCDGTGTPKPRTPPTDDVLSGEVTA